jgi:hypothetical protein
VATDGRALKVEAVQFLETSGRCLSPPPPDKGRIFRLRLFNNVVADISVVAHSVDSDREACGRCSFHDIVIVEWRDGGRPCRMS